MKYTTSILRQIRAKTLLMMGLLLLGSCARENTLPPCPNIFILSDAKQMDHFRPGPGRKLADIDYAVQVEGWKGSCGYKQRDRDWDVNMDLHIFFTVKRGPANTTGNATFSYFTAIPFFYPNDQAKQVIPLTVQFPSDKDSIKADSGEISLTLPVHSDDVIDNYTIYLGLQLQQDELNHNRKSQ